MAKKSSYEMIDFLFEFVHTKESYTKQYMREVARKVMDMNGIPKICVHCGCTDEDMLEVHHVDGNIFNTRLKNLIRYCGSCHNKRHAEEKRHAQFIKDAKRRNQGG